MEHGSAWYRTFLQPAPRTGETDFISYRQYNLSLRPRWRSRIIYIYWSTIVSLGRVWGCVWYPDESTSLITVHTCLCSVPAARQFGLVTYSKIFVHLTNESFDPEALGSSLLNTPLFSTQCILRKRYQLRQEAARLCWPSWPGVLQEKRRKTRTRGT
jgi:hypothetical protein